MHAIMITAFITISKLMVEVDMRVHLNTETILSWLPFLSSREVTT